MNFVGKIYLVIYLVYTRYIYTWYVNHKSIYLVYTWYIPSLNFPGFPDVTVAADDSEALKNSESGVLTVCHWADVEAGRPQIAC